MSTTSLEATDPANSAFLQPSTGCADSLVMTNPTNVTRQHILTVGLEDWFQVASFHNLINTNQWCRFETRLEQSTNATLELLDQFETKATFFVLGWIAEPMPELIRSIADRGHEIASRGYLYQRVKDLTADEFRDDLLKTNELLENASGQKIIGHRLADG